MRRRTALFALILVAVAGSYVAYLSLTTNFHTVLDGRLYRSAQPSGEQIVEWHGLLGIKTIVNLRGSNPTRSWYQVERAVTAALGIEMIDYRMSAKREVSADQVEELLAILAKAEPPVLIHCLDGADRSGLVSAFYVAGVAKGSELYAEFQLTPYYGHLPLWFIPYYAMDRSFESAEPRLGFPDS